MTDKNKGKSHATSLKPFHGSDKLLNHIQVVFGKSMKDVMVIYFEHIDSHLFQMAEKSGSHNRQKSHFESLKSIRVHKFNVLTSFLSTLKQTFKLFEEKKFNYFEVKITDAVKKNKTITASIDKNDIEEKLLQNTLIEKYDRIYQKDLIALQRRFAVLNASTIESHHIPICPHVLVSAFAKSIRLLHLDLEIKWVLYQLFETKVLSKIASVYQNTNKYLHDNGILPGVNNQILTEKVKKDNKNILPKQSASDKSKAGFKRGNSFVSYDSICDVLLNLQIKLIKDLSSNNSVDITPTDVKNALLIQFKRPRFKNKNQVLSQPDKDAVNLITMMFQLISGDRNIPAEIKRILTKLHIPYIKAAMTDTTLLTNKQHPAQLILTLITKASVGWNKQKDKGNKFILKVDKVIATIVEQDKLNPVFFVKQLDEYQGFIDEQKNEFKLEQNRVENKLKGRDRIVSAMKTVEALLTHKLNHVELPSAIRNMLLGAWKNLLVLLLVRHSDTSDKYLLKVNFIDELIEVVQSEQYEAILKKRIEKLCLEYAEGLVLVAYCGEGLESKVNDFKQCLFDIHQFGDKPEESKQVADVDSSKVEAKTDQVMTKIYSKVTDRDIQSVPEEVAQQKYTLTGLSQKDKKLINQIPIGTWFEFKRGNKNPVKAQLSWTSPKTGMFLFVNVRGLKVVDKMPKDLLKGLQDRSIVVLNKI
ncbi:MAG: DUF1631 domain-containing protein [Proteobacteria bacterium]|nr:DUF1631 domain-containing protein [Pseudomonadota bacterium]